ncbi:MULTISPECIES: hypothetical protein [Streptomyces]|jgi:hypothetical protein|uniref:Uncharacterized protein n=1 Tax=Streptomyces spinosisporus TaxID=2927582 RepID=A0ABS9XUK9_9ACTN|nr:MULTISPECIES: hypothetical protein [Streptomyces]MCI3245762.1 hypothetical protein [Streptomyces spinosisporus]WUB33450.1 hypothetical protein OHN38_00385 [Streptomyces sp. NBC_00588]
MPDAGDRRPVDDAGLLGGEVTSASPTPGSLRNPRSIAPAQQAQRMSVTAGADTAGARLREQAIGAFTDGMHASFLGLGWLPADASCATEYGSHSLFGGPQTNHITRCTGRDILFSPPQRGAVPVPHRTVRRGR